MDKFTPGPWSVIRGADCDGVVDSRGATVADLLSKHDAILIAAAPDLLAICQAIEAHCCANDGIKGEAHAAEGKRLRDQLQATITKATGA